MMQYHFVHNKLIEQENPINEELFQNDEIL
jgi:hypothetical protein